MNIPNNGPQLPVAMTPQAPIPAPMLPPSVEASLGCMGCGSSLPQLSDVAKPAVPLWLKLVGIAVFFGGVFGLLALTRRPHRPIGFPKPPR